MPPGTVVLPAAFPGAHVPALPFFENHRMAKARQVTVHAHNGAVPIDHTLKRDMLTTPRKNLEQRAQRLLSATPSPAAANRPLPRAR